MEENLNQDIVPVAPVEDIPTPPVNQPPFGSWWKVGGLVLGAVILAGGIFFAGYQYSQKQETTTLYPTPTPKTEACIQVITPARNPQTGECKDFPTPCDVPSGWITVESCSTVDETVNWKTYTNTEYKYHLKYPSDWKVEEYNYTGVSGKNVKEVRFDSPNNYFLLFGLKSKNADNAITGRTGVAAGDFVMKGTVKIGDTKIQVSQLVFENKIKEVYYSNKLGPGIIDLNRFDAIAEFGYRGIWNPQIDLKDLPELNIADQILSTFQFTQ